MKKYIWSILLSIVVGVYLGKFMLNQYTDFNVSPVSYDYDKLFFIEAGTFNSLDDMKNGMSLFNYYIYDLEDDNLYHSYVGITKLKENAMKIKEFYGSKGYDINIRENIVKSDAFISVVTQYDLLLSDADGDALSDICNQVLSSYEELVINEDKNEGSS